MRKIRRYAVVFLAGLFGGMLFIGAGYSIGRDSRRMGDYDRGYIQGYRDRQEDLRAAAFDTDFPGR